MVLFRPFLFTDPLLSICDCSIRISLDPLTSTAKPAIFRNLTSEILTPPVFSIRIALFCVNCANVRSCGGSSDGFANWSRLPSIVIPVILILRHPLQLIIARPRKSFAARSTVFAPRISRSCAPAGSFNSDEMLTVPFGSSTTPVDWFTRLNNRNA